MKSDFRIVLIIVLSLLFLSIVLPIVNYRETLQLAQSQIKKQSLPLTLDNIYTDIQKYIIEPFVISSVMANDTFVQNWLLFNENNTDKIRMYLYAIKKKYGHFTTFLVSEKTKKYYTNNGFLEVLDKNKKDNKWYFNFKKSSKINEINLDYNNKLTDSLLLFINYKIYDKNNKLIGITGVSQKMSYVNKMLMKFKNKYHVVVYIFNKKGDIILGNRNKSGKNKIKELDFFNLHRNEIIKKKAVMYEYKDEQDTYIINTKYISELDLYILARANLSSFTGSVVKTFYFNLLVSLFITLFVAIIIILVIKKYNRKLAANPPFFYNNSSCF